MRTLCSCDLMCVWCPLSNLKEELTYTNAWFRLIAWFGSVKKTPLPLVYTFSPFASTCWVEQFLFYSAHRGAHLALLQEFLFRFSRAMPNSPWYWKIIKQCRAVTKPKRVKRVLRNSPCWPFPMGSVQSEQAGSKAVFWRPAGTVLGIWDTGKLFNCVNRQLCPLSSFIVSRCHSLLFDLCLHYFEL